MRYGDRDGFGRHGILDTDEDGRLVCHECGRAWLHLSTHLAGAHGLTSEAYREAHGLGVATVLVAPAVRDRMRDGWERHRDLHVDALDQHRAPPRRGRVIAG